MPQLSPASFHVRKQPVQARSAASVDAILTATLQVLLDRGTAELTTTRVAARAGVSVGTLYQYFPNKSSLLQAVLRRHLQAISQNVECASHRHCGSSLHTLAEALISAYMEVKLRDPRASVALYRISGDLDIAETMRQLAGCIHHAIVAALRSASDAPADPETAATMLEGTMFGVSRQMLEGESTAEHVQHIRQQLIQVAQSYLATLPRLVEAVSHRSTGSSFAVQ